MWTVVICLFFGFLIGIAVTLGSRIGYDKMHNKRKREWFEQMEEALTGSDFCEMGCAYYENCHKRNTNHKDAMDELEHNYCFTCPIKMGTDLLEKYEV